MLDTSSITDQTVALASVSSSTMDLEVDTDNRFDYSTRGLRERHAQRESKKTTENLEKAEILPKLQARGLISTFLREKQTSFSSGVLVSIALLHNIPVLAPYTQKLFSLQYYDESIGRAEIGIDDAYFVLFWVIVLTFIRASLMEYILVPFAKRSGISSKKALTRFAEQGWSLFYYSTIWLWGMYLLANSEYSFSVKHVWIGWPHYQLEPSMKAYYLIELSGWFQQIYVLNVEERRKDYFQMFAHHIVTCVLIIGSYYYYYSRVGHVILVIMDVVDAILSTAKMLKYLGFSTVCDYMFGVFFVSWLILKHGLFNYITWSAMVDAEKLIPSKCYYDANGELVRCFNATTHWTFISMLWILQVITLIWLAMIVRVFIRILKGGSAEDTRSDDED